MRQHPTHLRTVHGAVVALLALVLALLASPASAAAPGGSSAGGAVEVTVSPVPLDGPAIHPVTVTVRNGSSKPVRSLEVTLDGPAGWLVAPEAIQPGGSLRPGDTLDLTFHVQVPEKRDGFRVYTFTATATYGGGDGAGRAVGVRHERTGEPLPSLEAAFDNVGVTDEANTAPGDFDGGGNSFSLQKLADVGIVPGGTVRAVGAEFTWPDVPVGTPDNATGSGQAIELDGTGSALAFLGSGSSFGAAGPVTVFYTDGTSSGGTVGFPNWSFQEADAHGATLVAATDGRNRPDGYGNAGIDYRVFANSVPLDAGKTVDFVVLPAAASFHVFDLALVP